MVSPQDRIIDTRRNWEARVEMKILGKPKSEMSTYDKLVYVALCGHANRDGGAFPYVSTLADEASCSTRQVFRALANLEARGLIARNPQITVEKGQVCTLYEVRGLEDYTPPDCVAQGEEEPQAPVSHAPRDCESGPYIRSTEQLQENIKDYSPSGREVEPPAEHLEPAKEDENLPVSEAPPAMKSVAEAMLFKTGRTGLMESEIAVLRNLNARDYPAVIHAEIDIAVERFKKLGRDLRSLNFGYIAEMRQHRKPTRPPTGAKPQSAPPKRQEDFSDLNV